MNGQLINEFLSGLKEADSIFKDIILFIGRFELAKRIKALTELELYELQLILKNSQKRKELAGMLGISEYEFEKLYGDLKFRRKYFRVLRTKGKKKRHQEEVERSIKEELANEKTN